MWDKFRFHSFGEEKLSYWCFPRQKEQGAAIGTEGSVLPYSHFTCLNKLSSDSTTDWSWSQLPLNLHLGCCERKCFRYFIIKLTSWQPHCCLCLFLALLVWGTLWEGGRCLAFLGRSTFCFHQYLSPFPCWTLFWALVRFFNIISLLFSLRTALRGICLSVRFFFFFGCCYLFVAYMSLKLMIFSLNCGLTWSLHLTSMWF